MDERCPVPTQVAILSRSLGDVKPETGSPASALEPLEDRVWALLSRRQIDWARLRSPEENSVLIWVSTADWQTRHFLLLDRDGIINADHPDYIKHRSEFRFYQDSLEALAWLHHHNIGTILISNQSGLNRGLISWEDFWDIHACLIEGVERAGGAILGAFYCPHRPEEGCSCRKPLPGMLQAAAARFRIDLAETWFLGDRESDLLAASRAGCRGVLLDRLGGTAESLPRDPAWERVRTFRSLPEAVLTLSAHALP